MSHGLKQSHKKYKVIADSNVNQLQNMAKKNNRWLFGAEL